MTSVAEVRLWGRTIGAVSLSQGERCAAFEYAPAFVGSGIEVAPLTMPLARRIYTFPGLPRDAFAGLPGLLSDSLPDRFGTALIDAWLATEGREPGSFDAVERLCYIGRRGMGALEYLPTRRGRDGADRPLDIGALVRLASTVLRDRRSLEASFGTAAGRVRGLADILRVGTSAGGARAKAVIAWNPTTGEVRSGQLDAAEGFEHWLLKFDGVDGNRDRELDDPQGFGAIELAYARMATDAGIEMSPCRLLEEGGRRHFMTRRFDRPGPSSKLHMQTLGALAHLDFNAAGAHSYEQAFDVLRRLGLPKKATEQLYARMVFNIVARNQDDHVKNIAFLMDRRGGWALAPAYDLTWAHNPAGAWTSRHQMSVAGKRAGFTLADLRQVARTATLPRGRASRHFERVRDVVARWPEYAEAEGVLDAHREGIAATHRLELEA